jgi:tetratricopeptide (TPR) repeat protein
MRELGLKQAELADALNAAHSRLYGVPGRTTDRYVRKLLNGTTTWPQDHHRACLESVLERNALELGFIPAGKGYVPTSGHTEGGGEEDGMHRRDFVRIGVGCAALVALPAVPDRNKLGMKDVERLREGLPLLHELDDKFGGGAAVEYAVASAERAQRAALSGRSSERVGQALMAAAGTYLSTAGWFAFDNNDTSAARRHFDAGLRMAVASDDDDLKAQTWSNMAQQARLEDPLLAIRLGRAALSLKIVRNDPKLAALFHCRIALGHTGRGEKGLAAASFRRAFQAFDRADQRPRPPWLAFWDEAELTGLVALSGLKLGRYRDAEEGTRESLDLHPESKRRNRLLYTIRLAEAQLGARDVDRALATAGIALGEAVDSQSPRVLSYLDLLASHLSAWRLPAVEDWMERYSYIRGAIR